MLGEPLSVLEVIYIAFGHGALIHRWGQIKSKSRL